MHPRVRVLLTSLGLLGAACSTEATPPPSAIDAAADADPASDGAVVIDASSPPDRLVAADVRAVDAPAACRASFDCPAAHFCDMGACAPHVCVPGSSMCVTATTRRLCNQIGSASTVVTCTPAPHAPVVACMAGACMTACERGWGDCDGNSSNGCEASLTTAARCGACGHACADGQTCTDGVCS